MPNPHIKNHILTLAIICGSLVSSTNQVHATVADGVYAYEKGDYTKAREEWLPYAALGNPNALYNLGQLSRMGRGVDKNYLKAKDYYLRAAEKGHVGAQRNLGTLYYFGRTGEVNHTEAFNWLQKAAINGDSRSQLMTGTMYFNGEAPEKSNIKAYAWIFLSSQYGLKSATTTLTKLNDVMTSEQVKTAKELAPNLLSRILTPDDVGLMVDQQEASADPEPEFSTPSQPVATAAPSPAEPETPETSTVDQAIEASPAAEIDAEQDARADIFRVQLGSFRSEDKAKKALSAIEEKLSYILDDKYGKIEFADLGEKGIYYRLQLAPFETKYDAEALCSKLKDNSQNCYVVKTR